MPPIGKYYTNYLVVIFIIFYVGVKRKAETSSNTKDDCRDVKIGKSRVMKVENEQEDWDKTDKIVQISSKAKKIIGCECIYIKKLAYK